MQAFAQARLPLAFQPGTDFRYSFSIDVLGYIIQLASGQPFDEFLQERIFAPLGMPDTAFWVPPEKVDRFAAIYGPAEGGGLKVVEPFGGDITQPTRSPFGGGGLVSTAGDYFRFGQMLLNGGELDGVRLLGRKTVEWMLQNHLPDGVHPDGRAGQRLRPGRRGPAPPGSVPPPGLARQVRLGRGCQHRVVDRSGRAAEVPDHAAVHALLYHPDRGGFRPTGLSGT